MKLYHRKFFTQSEDNQNETMEEQFPVTKPGPEYIINQIIIWISIVFIAVIIIKKFL